MNNRGPAIPTVEVAQLPADGYLLDVREADEWECGHAPEAVHLPMSELMARVQALLRRSQARHDVLGYADLTLDANARRVMRDGQEIVLTRMEFGLLELLMRNAEQVLSYDVIRERVWGYGEAPASNALTVFVGFLRRKLEIGGRPRLLHNVRGVGYVIRAAP